MDRSIKEVKKMFLGYGNGVLLLILCCLGAAIENDVVHWDVNGDRLYIDFGEPLDRSSASLGVFALVSVENIDRRLDVDRLQVMFPNVTVLELRRCDLATISAASMGKTMRNITLLRY